MLPIRISIGSEPMQYVPAAVLQSSILRRTSIPVEFTLSWGPESGWHNSITMLKNKIRHPERFRGTDFNLWRWLVPSLYGNEGMAIYLDCDQIVLTDIAELWGTLLNEAAVGMVCNAAGFFGTKKPQPGDRQTSVMLLDCKKCDWNVNQLCLDVDYGRMLYAEFMQARWLKLPIKELAPEWNHFGVCRPETKLIHWSHVASQPYRNPKHETASVFQRELKAAVSSGILTVATIKAEVAAGHLHKNYLIGL